MKDIRKIFIANRGEICRRIALGAKTLGIQSCTLVDRKLTPEYLQDVVDDLITVDGLQSRHYLDQDFILTSAIAAGADAIHPGYGYLSENSIFADKVVKNGLVWIGPHPQSMEQMASKAISREIALQHQVPCLTSLKFKDMDDVRRREKELEKFSKELGFPVLIKATMGGGGKGMRIVTHAEDLLQAAERASSEALNAFGDGEVLVEKYIEKPRHIEVQILGDKHGHAFAIGDRDCSVQRRHQKIIEEAPAPGLSAATRRELHAAACRLSAAVGYDSAGTVEFLLDSSLQNGDLQPFYFLEMNTRLQVEHPVTEECYGLDLVAWQIRMARGEKLPESMKDLKHRCHAMEFRIYAEDCEENFMPAPGPLDLFLPASGIGVRWDVGIDAVDAISPEFDPMIAKLIVQAPTREECLAKAHMTLMRSVISGTKNNHMFLAALCLDQEFGSGAVTTDFIKRRLAGLLKHQEEERHRQEQKIETLWEMLPGIFSEVFQKNSNKNRDNIDLLTQRLYSPGDALTQRRASGIIVTRQTLLRLQGRSVEYVYLQVGTSQPWSCVAYARTYLGRKRFGIISSGYSFVREEEAELLDSYQSKEKLGNAAQAMVPGKVVTIRCEEGQNVKKNEVLLILESMKMEFEVRADQDRIVDKVLVTLGQQVEAGTHLINWQDS